MHVSIKKSNLLKAVGHVQNVVEKRNTIPILSHILIETNKNEVVITATDLEMTFIQKIEADVKKEGSVTISAHLVHDIVKKLSNDHDVEIFFDEEFNRVKITHSSSEFLLPSLSPDDFPVTERGEFDCNFSLDNKDWSYLIDHTRFAMSQEESRYYLNGIYIHIVAKNKENYIRTVATDGHRLALAERHMENKIENFPSVIIPKKLVLELSKILLEDETEIHTNLSSSLIKFEFGNLTIISKLIDGNFPDYENVIPAGNDKEVVVKTADFTNAVDLVSTVSEKARSVKLNLNEKRLFFKVNNPELGSASEDIDVQYNGENLEIGFNSRYLLEAANQIDSDNMRLYFADSKSPALIKDGDKEDLLYVLMPLRI